MRLWHLPARALPVPRRPFADETVVSYTRRLAEANELGPTEVLRSLGEIRVLCGAPPSPKRDALLNERAIERLETISGVPRSRLERALPALRNELRADLPTDRPYVRGYTPWPRIQPACAACSAGRAAGSASVHITAANRVCRRHRRWLDGPQIDLTAAHFVIRAHSRYQRLAAERWTELALTSASGITRWWTSHADKWHPELNTLWLERARQLGVATVHPAVTLPETVALARIMTNLTWRRQVAMAHPHEVIQFYEHVARTTHANPDAFNRSYQREPLTGWVGSHRSKFAEQRNTFHAASLLGGGRTRPLPEIGQFK